MDTLVQLKGGHTSVIKGKSPADVIEGWKKADARGLTWLAVKDGSIYMNLSAMVGLIALPPKKVGARGPGEGPGA